jgi:hypothetical protein
VLLTDGPKPVPRNAPARRGCTWQHKRLEAIGVAVVDEQAGTRSNHDVDPRESVFSIQLEQRADLTVTHGLIGKHERAAIAHLARGAEKCAERGSRQRAANAHSLDAER